jgi:ribonuclease BN (tRNA processing enzyme)
MKIKIFGCRGSAAVSRPGSRYGGNTSCMIAESDGEIIVLDAGSGLNVLQEEYYGKNGSRLNDKAVNIFISHLHLDHIIGLGTFGPVWGRDAIAKIYTCSRDERPIREQVLGVFSPPYWPVTMKNCSDAEVIQLLENRPMKVGVFTITPFLAKHPDHTLSFHLTDGKKTLVHLLDNEIAQMHQSEHDELLHFCSNADMVVFDAAYSNEDYLLHTGWGHSTVGDGVKLAEECKCKKMMFSHLGRHYSDEQLDSWMDGLDSEKFIISHDGLEMEI